MKKTFLLFIIIILIIIISPSKEKYELNSQDIITNQYEISSGKNHSLLKTNQGEVFAWGSWGDISLESSLNSINRIYPTNITQLFDLESNDKIEKVFSGEQHSFVLSKLGRVFAFGFDGQGQLGDGGEIYQVGDLNYASQLKKDPIEITNNFTLIDNDYIIKLSGGANFSLALSKNGEIFSFGENNQGQLGDINITTYQTTPLNITSQFELEEDEKIIDIKTGASHALALSNYGKLYVWGNNNFGQLCNNQPGINLTKPTLLDLNNEKVIKIACGSFHTYFLTSLNHLYGCGFNGFGQLADKNVIVNSGNDKYLPYEMSINFNLEENETIVDIYSGHYFGMAITSLNNIYSFGQNNNGQLGCLNNLSSSTPINITKNIPLSSEDYIVALGMGEKHVIAVSKNQTIYAWGDNGQYQLGSNISIDHTWRPLDITAKFPPIINFSMYGSSSYQNTYDIIIEAYYVNNLALDDIYYIFTHSDTITPSNSDNWQKINNGEEISLAENEGTYYLWVKVITIEDEEYYKVSKAFLIDKIKPSLIVTTYDNNPLENGAILNDAVYVKANDNNSAKIAYRINKNQEFIVLEQNEHIFVTDGYYEIKAIDIANNESDIFTFIIDTIPPKILKIDTHIISQVNYQTTRQKIKIIASEIVSGYIYNDDDFITALETETDQFEITLKKGINKICLVDISGKTSETYYIEYNPTFFQDSELMLYVFTSLAGGLILIIIIVYVFKTRKKLKFEDNI